MTWGMAGSQVHDEGLTAGASALPDPVQRRLAVRQVASLARDAADCVHLLDVLGLAAVEGVGENREETR
jgi:hypothetical protein